MDSFAVREVKGRFVMLSKRSVSAALIFVAAVASFVVGATGCKKEEAARQEGAHGPQVVPGPGFMPECFAPWNKDTKFFQWTAKKPPFRLALVNGYVGNAWRIQMVKTAKAFAKDPAVAPMIKEFKVV